MEAMTAPTSNLTIGVFPQSEPRLIRALSATESLDSYRATGGYQPLGESESMLEVINESGVLGRGGAAFPLAIKLSSVRQRSKPGAEPVAVANGEEGEPTSVKDRWLLRFRPHLVLDGLRLAAHVIGARRAYVYVSDDLAARTVQDAITELRAGGLESWDDGLELAVVTVLPAYVAGEETAAVRAINGGPAKPTDKPPRPFESGVAGRPTLVSNVETLANLPFLHRHGAIAFRSLGTSGSPGTFLATVTGAGRDPGLYELPHGTSVVDLLRLHGVSPDDVDGVLMGGYFAGLVNRRILDMTLDHETLRRFNTGLGCGALAILTATECPVAVAASVMQYYDHENAGQCGSCFNGTAAMSAVTGALRDGVAEPEDVERLTRWSVVLRSRGACGTLDGATNVAATLIQEFPEILQRHLDGECSVCDSTPFQARRPFEVEMIGQV
jgi:NADH:ubiquinone oxidoreductase subunit F (NADH-binding)